MELYCLFFPAHVRDPGNQSHVIHNFTINVRDFNAQTPAATLAKKMLNDIVAASQPENNRSNVITVGDYDLQISGTALSLKFENNIYIWQI